MNVAASEEAGREALGKIDAVLAGRPEKDDLALSAATRALTAYREAMIAQAEPDNLSDRDRLERLNSVLAVVLGLHFPIGEPIWDELQKARGWLAELL